jgi:hypothetical protein
VASDQVTKFGKSMLLKWTGQLYVACLRIGKPSDLFVYTPEEKTKNIVYSKALQ